MVGKTKDSGFRDTEFEIKRQIDTFDESISQIDNWINQLNEKKQCLIDKKNKADELKTDLDKRADFISKWRNESHFKLDTPGIRKRLFNTFDIDELINNYNFEMLIVEQGNDNFKTFSINEYKSVIDSSRIPNLKDYQEKALARLGYELKIPVACFWLFNNADGTYFYAMKIIYNPKSKENTQKCFLLNEKTYAEYQCYCRNYHKTMPDFVKTILDTKNPSDAYEALKVYKSRLENAGWKTNQNVIDFLKELEDEDL